MSVAHQVCPRLSPKASLNFTNMLTPITGSQTLLTLPRLLHYLVTGSFFDKQECTHGNNYEKREFLMTRKHRLKPHDVCAVPFPVSYFTSLQTSFDRNMFSFPAIAIHVPSQPRPQRHNELFLPQKQEIDFYFHSRLAMAGTLDHRCSCFVAWRAHSWIWPSWCSHTSCSNERSDFMRKVVRSSIFLLSLSLIHLP